MPAVRSHQGDLHTTALWVVFLSIVATAGGQTYTSHIEHPIVRYKMTARLDPETKTIKGHYTLTWWNHTEDSIPDLYFHLYLNAFKNVDSTFIRESSISRRRARLDEWIERPGQEKWGWVNVERIQIVGGADLGKTFVHPDDGNASDQTVMRVALPEPIPPLGTIKLAVDFTSKLPRAFARTGYDGDTFLVAQWFPKIGVYEGYGDLVHKFGLGYGPKHGAWNCHEFHANTEFFADYGEYDVELTVPSNYVVGATGYLRGKREGQKGTTTYNFYQNDVHDFAWTASPHFLRVVKRFNWKDAVRPEEVLAWSKILNLPPEQITLRDVDITLLLQPGHLNLEDRYLRATENALKYFGLWYGQYPYDTLTVVDPPNDTWAEKPEDPPRESNIGGMEYPTFITGGTYFWPGEHSFEPESVTVHEFGHQFWYGLVGNNEFEEAWLDEGFNTYSTTKVLEVAYGGRCGYIYFFGMPVPALPWLIVKVPAFPFAGVEQIPMGAYFSCVEKPEWPSRSRYLEHAKDDDLARNGWQYIDGSSYVVNSYHRPALALRTLENYLGSEPMARILRAYQQRWRYRHPTTRDFIATVNEVAGKNMDWFFDQFFYNSNLVDYAVSEIRNEPLTGEMGVYDEGDRKKFHPGKATVDAFIRSKEKRYRSTVVVRRLGEVVAPVDVMVRFENGETVRERWDGKYRWIKFIYEKTSKVKSAEVDPERRLALDANFTNNSRLESEDNRGAARWYVRWIFWLENLFFAASFFS